MVQLENLSSPPQPLNDVPVPPEPSDPITQTWFNPSRSKLIGIIRRKAMIKDLAAIYHAECLAYCQELLELQKKVEEVSNIILKLLCSYHFEEVLPFTCFL
ncbi:unnamed protein product [Withania somnifera]